MRNHSVHSVRQPWGKDFATHDQDHTNRRADHLKGISYRPTFRLNEMLLVQYYCIHSVVNADCHCVIRSVGGHNAIAQVFQDARSPALAPVNQQQDRGFASILPGFQAGYRTPRRLLQYSSTSKLICWRDYAGAQRPDHRRPTLVRRLLTPAKKIIGDLQHPR